MDGRRVILSGVAADFKAGAALMLDDGEPVLVGGKRSWDVEFLGTRVTASGILMRSAPPQTELVFEQISAAGWFLDEAQVHHRNASHGDGRTAR